jgi:parallel beta-helix repeat protein
MQVSRAHALAAGSWSDISSQSSARVSIHDGADPRLRRNQIRDGQGVGIYVYDGGRGTLEDNNLTGNARGA